MKNDEIERATMRRVYWRLIPLLFLGVFLNYLDRINIGFASLRMNRDLGLTSAAFGFTASVFFVGYMLLGVPSNLMMSRVGARRWLPVVLVAWGLLASATAFIAGAGSFSVVRFILGAAEAGALPGFALYITFWFPAAYKARAVAGYIIAGQVAAIVGSPLAAFLIEGTDNVLGLHGWQWMFLIEGLPTVVLGLVFFLLLTERPAEAKWLTPEQRGWLQERLDAEREALGGGFSFSLRDVLTDGRVWSLAGLFGCALVGIYGTLIWLPQIINGLGKLSLTQIGFLSAVPPMLGVASQLLVGYSSDRTGDRKFHIAGVYVLGAAALAASALCRDPVLSYLLLCVAGFGIYAGNPLFWSLTSSVMTGAAGAGAIAFINSVAQFGGLVGPYMLGKVKDATGSFSMALLAIAAFLLVAAAIAACMRVAPRGTAGRAAGPARERIAGATHLRG